jgi:beta-glucosidase
MTDQFPAGFVWGAASASYQVEGAVSEDGRGPSCWDVFVRRPGMVHHGDTGDVACDSYHRLDEDLDLLAHLGVGSYRFSVSWSRVLPEGRGEVNQPGLDYYRRLVDGLASRGIDATLTLFHWDLPQALQEKGGWANRECASWFADYAEVVAGALGGRVARWITLNEPAVVADRGYRRGDHAPGLTDGEAAAAVTHHLLLGHGLATRRLHEHLGPGAQVGITLDPLHTVALDDDDADMAVEIAGGKTDLYLLPVLAGVYPELGRREVVPQGPVVHPGDMDVVSTAIDFLGLNYYDALYIRRNAGPLQRHEERLEAYPGVVSVKPEHLPRSSLGWVIDPDNFRDAVLAVSRRAPSVPLYITENGCACWDYAGPDGEVRDPERIDYLRGHLRALKQAIYDGADVRGYFVWSFLDNFEWTDGFSQRLGLVYVDYPSQRRILKSSAHFYARVVAANGLPTDPGHDSAVVPH